MTAMRDTTYVLPPALQSAVAAKLEDWSAQGGTRRLFAGDATLWSGRDEASWLGWIGIVKQQIDQLAALVSLREEIRKGNFSHILLLGMGGSSLCPEVWKE